MGRGNATLIGDIGEGMWGVSRGGTWGARERADEGIKENVVALQRAGCPANWLSSAGVSSWRNPRLSRLSTASFPYQVSRQPSFPGTPSCLPSLCPSGPALSPTLILYLLFVLLL